MPATYGTLRPQRSFWILLGLIALFGMAQASATLGWSLSTDEPFTANTVHRSWSDMWATFRTDNIFPVHYVLLWGWVRIFGESEIALRIPSLLFFGATILVVGRTAQRASRSRAGLMAASLLALSTNMGQVHAASARPYALLGLLVALTTHITFNILCLFSPPSTATVRPPARGWHFLLMGLHTLGLLTHPLYAFVMATLTVAALWVSRRAFIEMVVDSVVAGALFLLVDGSFLIQTLNLPTTAWMKIPDLKDLADGWLNLWGEQKTLLIGGYVVALGLWRWPRIRPALTSRLMLVGLTLLALTGFGPFIISQIKPVYIDSRAPIIFLPIACVLAAVLMRHLDQRWLSLGLLMVLSAAATLAAYRLWSGPERTPARASLLVVATQAECGDVFVLGSLSLSETEYYFRQFKTPACLQLETFPGETAQHPGWLDGPGLLAQPERLHREAAQTAERLAQSATRVWLFYDSQFYPEIGDVIKTELGQQLALTETLDLRGSFFDSILIYAPQGDSLTIR